VRGRWRWPIAGLTAGVAVVAIARGSWLSGPAPASVVPTLQVRQAAFARSVVADGNLRAAKATALAAPPTNEGPLKIAWMAPDGSAVKQGQVVIRFDPTELEKKLEDGRSDRASAAARIEKERTQTDAALRDRDRTVHLSEAELEKTRRFPSRDPLVFSRNQIIESEIDETLSTEKQSHAAATQRIEGNLSRSKLELITLERRRAELAIQQAKKGLASMEVTAPHDGIVVFELDWRGNLPKVGDSVWAGQRLASLPLLDEMEAEVFVLEADAGGLLPGLGATVVLESHPETVYSARIKQVDKLAKPRIRDVPINYFAVTLALEKTDRDRMKPGQRVQATLILDQQRALAIPRQAVIEQDGRQVVYVAGAHGFEPAAVKLGASSPGLVVVESGLRDGDRIALRDPTRPLEPVGKTGQKEAAP
jgi:RND family efflux transporter MFP subunit